MSLEIEYARRWTVDGKEFPNKAAAHRYVAFARLEQVTGDNATAIQLSNHADEVIALLRPFATPKVRKRGNGTQAKAPSQRRVPRQAEATAD